MLGQDTRRETFQRQSEASHIKKKKSLVILTQHAMPITSIYMHCIAISFKKKKEEGEGGKTLVLKKDKYAFATFLHDLHWLPVEKRIVYNLLFTKLSLRQSKLHQESI